MWFIVLALMTPGKPLEPVASLANWKFPTETACMASAAERVNGMRAIGAHGRYLCMYSGEPDGELARAQKVSF